MASSDFRESYLEEMARVDEYLVRTRGAADAPASEDPEVRRLLEAVSYFSAQTQQMAYEATVDSLEGLIGQRLDFVQRPLVSRGLLSASYSSSKAVLHLPQGTPFLVQARDGRSTQLSTEVSAVVAPLRVCHAQMEGGAGTPRLVLGIETEATWAGLGVLSLHVDVLGDRARSMALHRALARGCRAVRLLTTERAVGRAVPPQLSDNLEHCPRLEATFGPRTPIEADFDPKAFDRDLRLSPLETARAHFQFPERDLFVNVVLPTEGDAAAFWKTATRFWIALELDAECALGPLSVSCFRPNVLPVQNLVRAPAQPIEDAGFQRRYPLLPPSGLGPHQAHRGALFELHSVERVVDTTGGAERTLFPSALGDPETSYRLVRKHGRSTGRGASVELVCPGTVAEPRSLRVEAAWTESEMNLRSWGKLRVRPWRLSADGMEWKLLPRTAGPVPSPVEGSVDRLVELLALSNRSRLEREEVLKVARLICSGTEPPWSRLVEALGGMTVSEEPTPEGTGILIRRFTFEVRPIGEELEPLLDDFFEWIGRVLSEWGGELVEVVRAKREAGGRSSRWEATS